MLAIFTGEDLGELGLAPHTNPTFPEAMRRPFVAIGTVRYVGQPVVAVIAEERAQAADAAELVLVDYDPLPVVVDPEAALRDDVVLFPDHGTNVVMRFASPTQADFSACDVVVEERIVNQRLTAAPIETRSGRRLLDRRRTPRPLLGVSGRAPDEGPAGRDLRARPVRRAGGRARRRRRLRGQVAHVPGGARPRLLRP